jgi:hypothetical protein
MLANHYRSVLERFRELKAEIDKATSKGAESIPPDIFDPATVKTVINFSIERLARFEKRSRQLADMHGADIRA